MKPPAPVTTTRLPLQSSPGFRGTYVSRDCIEVATHGLIERIWVGFAFSALEVALLEVRNRDRGVVDRRARQGEIRLPTGIGHGVRAVDDVGDLVRSDEHR